MADLSANDHISSMPAPKDFAFASTKICLNDKIPVFAYGPLDPQQVLAIQSAIGAIAFTENTGHETVRSALETKFCVDTISKIGRRDYAQAMNFLLDLHLDEMRSKR